MPDGRDGWPSRFASTPADRVALLRMSHAQTLLPRDIRDLAARERSASGCLRAVRAGAGSATDRAIVDAVDVEAVHRALEGAGARFVVPGDREYHPRLLELPDPPAWLFVRGRRHLHEVGPAVAVVGARNATPYGRDVASLIAARLAAAGVAVISGAARGIDAAAHLAALEAGGPTIAVLGSGIDVPYPASSRGLLERIAGAGTLVSEYPPGMPAAPRRFPARNRILAALAQAVVVVEGADASGSLITADFAQQLGRSVLAVPGPIDNPLSLAPHGLIRDGARIILEPEDVLREIGLLPEGGSTAAPVDLSPEERAVLRTLSGSPATLESVARAARLPAPRVMVALSGLELRGLAASSGGRYRRASEPSSQKRRDAQTSGTPRSAVSAASADTG